MAALGYSSVSLLLAAPESPTTTTTMMNTNSPPATPTPPGSDSSLSSGALAGIIIGCVVGSILLMGLIYFVAKKGQNGSKHIAFDKYMTEAYDTPMKSPNNNNNNNNNRQFQQQGALFTPKEGDSTFVNMNNLMTMQSANEFVDDDVFHQNNQGSNNNNKRRLSSANPQKQEWKRKMDI
jgi:hypothetical protein